MESQETINDMVDKIIAGNNVSAKDDFDIIIANKVSSALEAKKQELAQSLYAGQIDQSREEEEITDESSQ